MYIQKSKLQRSGNYSLGVYLSKKMVQDRTICYYRFNLDTLTFTLYLNKPRFSLKIIKIKQKRTPMIIFPSAMFFWIHQEAGIKLKQGDIIFVEYNELYQTITFRFCWQLKKLDDILNEIILKYIQFDTLLSSSGFLIDQYNMVKL